MKPSASVILTPYYGPSCHEHYQALRKLDGIPQLTVVGCAGVDVARNVLMEAALKTPAEVFVWLDSDLSVTRADYEQLVASAVSTRGVVGAPYLTKSLNGRQRQVGLFRPGIPEVKFYEAGDCYPAAELGFGFTALHRSAVERVIEQASTSRAPARLPFRRLLQASTGVQAWPLFSPYVLGDHYLIDDAAFCQRALDTGVELYLDTRPRGVLHHGAHAFRLEDVGYVSVQSPELAYKMRDSAHPAQ